MQDRNNTDNSYDDIINHPHHVSTRHPRMSMIDRAAQFSPFAALTGYGDVIKETARLTDRKLELSESEKAELDYKLRMASDLSALVITPEKSQRLQLLTLFRIREKLAVLTIRFPDRLRK